MYLKWLKIGLVVIGLLIIMLFSCRFAVMQPPLATDPCELVEPSENAMERITSNLFQAAIEAIGTGRFRVRVSNQELTSYVLLDLLKERADVPLNELYICFEPNIIHSGGELQAPFNTPIPFQIQGVTHIEESGKIRLEVLSARAGWIPVPFVGWFLADIPQRGLNNMNDYLRNATKSELFGFEGVKIEIDEIQILAGEVIILGRPIGAAGGDIPTSP